MDAHKRHTKKMILTTFAVGAAGGWGYVGWQLYKKKMQQKRDRAAGAGNDLDSLLKSTASASMPDETLPTLPAAKLPSLQTTRSRPAVSTPVRVPSSDGSDFPLKKG